MKLKLLIFLSFFSIIVYGQMTDLAKLSNGKFYSSDVIKDGNNNIKGYFLLFQSDKVAKETYELEYIVLDENLTKVTNGFISEMKYEAFAIKAVGVKVEVVTLYKNKLLLAFFDDFITLKEYRRYRILDISTNVMSDPIIYRDNQFKVNPKFDRVTKNYLASTSDWIYYFDGPGLVTNSAILDKKNNAINNYFATFDNDFNELWRYSYNNVETDDKNKFKSFHICASDKDVLVIYNHITTKKGRFLNDYTIMFLDAKTGVLREEYALPDIDKYAYVIKSAKIQDGKIYVMGNFSAKSDYGGMDDFNNKGLFNFVFDKQTLKLIERKLLKWEDVGSKIEISKKGFIKKEGYIYIHDMLLLSNNNIVVVAETFSQNPVTANNMYFFELNKDFTINQVFTVDKFRNKYPGISLHSSDIKNYGLFDFIDYQDLGDDDFLFFMNDNEKKSKNRRKTTMYGIISYVDGKFARQTLNLKTDSSTIDAYNAKKGYLMMVEKFDDINKPVEYRLEKINY
jgi:hypothetical protein